MEDMATHLSLWKSKVFESLGQHCESDAVTSRTTRDSGHKQQVTSAAVTTLPALHGAPFTPNLYLDSGSVRGRRERLPI